MRSPVEALAARRETHAQRPAIAPKLHDIHPSFSRLVSRHVLLRHPQLSRKLDLEHSTLGPKGPEPFQEAGVVRGEPGLPHPRERNALDEYTNFVYDGGIWGLSGARFEWFSAPSKTKPPCFTWS